MIVQGTAEWFAARVGKITASRVADVIAKTKTGWGASRANYAAELMCERLTGVTAPSFINDAMKLGRGAGGLRPPAYASGTASRSTRSASSTTPRSPCRRQS
jgi:hypothetical protein